MNSRTAITHLVAGLQRSTRSLLCAVVVPLLLATVPAGAENGATSKEEAARTEYQLKAGYLFNFAKFIQWPGKEDASTNIFRIGILDDGSVYPVMRAALTNTTIGTHPVQVERVTSYRNAKRVRILFIANTQERKLPRVLKSLGAAPVLTIGETPGFARDGGCINLARQEENIRFEINLHAAERTGLKVSSKLASIAKVVETREESP